MSPTHRSTRAASLAAVTCVLALALAGCSKPATLAVPAKVQQVGVHRVSPQRLTITTELPGRTSASVVAEIRPQVSGIVLRRLFEEGAQVHAGQVLYQIDPAGFRASYAGAQAGVAKAETTVASARVAARRSAELPSASVNSRIRSRQYWPSFAPQSSRR